jgi:hypothetical protein
MDVHYGIYFRRKHADWSSIHGIVLRVWLKIEWSSRIQSYGCTLLRSEAHIGFRFLALPLRIHVGDLKIRGRKHVLQTTNYIYALTVILFFRECSYTYWISFAMVCGVFPFNNLLTVFSFSLAIICSSGKDFVDHFAISSKN